MILIEPHPTLVQLKINAMQSQEEMEGEMVRAGKVNRGNKDRGGKESAEHL